MSESIRELGLDFSLTKEVRIFNKIYEYAYEGVINYYSCRGYDKSIVDGAFNEAMTQIWLEVDKIDMVKYSISTMIYLKTKQILIKYKDKAFKTIGYGGAMFDENYALSNMGEGVYRQSQNVHNQMTLQRAESRIDHWLGQIDRCYESKLIAKEYASELVKNVLNVKYGDMIVDHYYNELSYKDLQKKYDMNLDTVKNKMFAGRKNCKLINDAKDLFLR